jgi:hypothetical protein
VVNELIREALAAEYVAFDDQARRALAGVGE